MKATPRLIGATLLLVGLAVTGCDAAEPPVCDSFAAAQTTVDHIKDANVSENGLAALKPHLGQLKDQLATLYADAKDQYAPQTAQLKADVDQLASTLSSAAATPTAASLAAVGSAIAAVRTSAQALHEAMANTC